MIFDLVLFGFAIALTVGSNFFASLLLKSETPDYRLLHPFGIIISLLSVGFFYFLLFALQDFSYQSLFIHLLFGFAFATTAQTDAQTLLISRWTSIFLAPVAWLSSNMGLISITPLSSIIGATLGLLTLAITARVAYNWTGQESIGQGDIDFLAFIGAFLGPLGCWRTLLIGSISGSLFGIACFTIQGKMARNMKLPFGTFLAIGAMAELLTQLYGISFFSF